MCLYRASHFDGAPKMRYCLFGMGACLFGCDSLLSLPVTEIIGCGEFLWWFLFRKEHCCSLLWSHHLVCFVVALKFSCKELSDWKEYFRQSIWVESYIGEFEQPSTKGDMEEFLSQKNIQGRHRCSACHLSGHCVHCNISRRTRFHSSWCKWSSQNIVLTLTKHPETSVQKSDRSGEDREVASWPFWKLWRRKLRRTWGNPLQMTRPTRRSMRRTRGPWKDAGCSDSLRSWDGEGAQAMVRQGHEWEQRSVLSTTTTWICVHFWGSSLQ